MAVSLVFRHNISAADCFRIKSRLDGSLFNIRRLQAVTKVTNDTIFDLQYADLPSHTPDRLQRQLDAISSAYSRAGLVVNSKKTEILHLPSHTSPPPTFFVSGDQLGLTEQFTYLGGIITCTCDLAAEIQHRVNLATAFFGRLSKRVFPNRDLSTRTKMAVYNAICVSTLLYACEGWTPYRRHIRALEAFHIQCFQTILHVHWWDKNTWCRDLSQSRHNMPSDNTPPTTAEVAWPCDKDAWKQTSPPPTLQWTLLRPTFGGGQKKRFNDYIKSYLSKCGISFDRFEELTRDREEWRAVCDKGLATFEQQHVDVAEAKRIRRHQQRNPPHPTTTRQGSACTVCRRVRTSAFGLRSHMCGCKETRWAASSWIRRTTKKKREAYHVHGNKTPYYLRVFQLIFSNHIEVRHHKIRFGDSGVVRDTGQLIFSCKGRSLFWTLGSAKV